MKGAVMLISVVVPCYNEEPVIRETHRRLLEVLEQLEPDRFEILYVNDGSCDRTLELLEELQALDARVRV
ncbi:MAG: glycosyltransferase, partial [Acidobacteria bacterium]|nr:glycosyltransferase [Acidobacteriota bacterium]